MTAQDAKNAKKITKKQKAVLDFIAQTIEETGIAPTVRDICVGLGLSSPSTVHVHLKTLEEKGYIHRDPLKSRCITVVGQERNVSPAPTDTTSPSASGSFPTSSLCLWWETLPRAFLYSPSKTSPRQFPFRQKSSGIPARFF